MPPVPATGWVTTTPRSSAGSTRGCSDSPRCGTWSGCARRRGDRPGQLPPAAGIRRGIPAAATMSSASALGSQGALAAFQPAGAAVVVAETRISGARPAVPAARTPVAAAGAAVSRTRTRVSAAGARVSEARPAVSARGTRVFDAGIRISAFLPAVSAATSWPLHLLEEVHGTNVVALGLDRAH